MITKNSNKLKAGDFVRINYTDSWHSAQFGWDAPQAAYVVKYGVVLDLYHAAFNTTMAHDTWKVRLTDGSLGIYPSKELSVLASK
jgi:hypothetical protein